MHALQPAMIQGFAKTGEVFFDREVLDITPSLTVRRHSPSGFGWGYAGSGPSQLALAILLRLTDVATAQRLYQRFKEAFVAQWDAREDFCVPLAACQAWLAQQTQLLVTEQVCALCAPMQRGANQTIGTFLTEMRAVLYTVCACGAQAGAHSLEHPHVLIKQQCAGYQAPQR